jgi:DNA-binding response OmpR family regulator
VTERLARRRVLFVEDESGLRRAYERYFGARYDARFAATGAEALDALRGAPPEVLVLDLRLPDADGLELLREIRTLEPTLPVIVTTSYTSMQPLIEVLGIEHSGFLLKPFDLNDLGARIDAAR